MNKYYFIFLISVLILLLSNLNNTISTGDNNLENFQIIINDNNNSKHLDLAGNNIYFFTENLGQWDPELLFIANTPFGHIGLGNGGVYYNIREIRNMPGDDGYDPNYISTFEDSTQVQQIKGHVVKLGFMDANEILPVGFDPLQHKTNFFIGGDPTKWVSGAMNYERIIYRDLWDGIDLVYYFNEFGLKYDYIVHPLAYPENIRIEVKGHKYLDVNDRELRMETPIGVPLFDSNLKIFYKDNNELVNGNFKLQNENIISFELDDYNPSREIVIDPLIYSNLIGSFENDYFYDMTVDSDGNVLVTGSTTSTTFPTKSGSYDTVYNGGEGDIFIFKLDSSGSDWIFSTYIGGSDYEWPRGIAVDSNNNPVITGVTYSNDFPNTTGAYDRTLNGTNDAFILKLNEQGSALMFSTYFGGENIDGGNSITLNDDDTIFVTGVTTSLSFPNSSNALDQDYNGATDIFISKFNPDCSVLNYSTYIGGNRRDSSPLITIDMFDNIYIVGETESSNFPVTNGCYDDIYHEKEDIFALKISSDGLSLVYSTFIGTNDSEFVHDLILDEVFNLYFIGETESTEFPVTDNAYMKSSNGDDDCFITKLNPQGTELLYSTYLGGTGSDRGHGIVLDEKRNIYVTGISGSDNFPTTPGAYNTNKQIWVDIFVTVFDQTGSTIIYSTYIGGNNTEIGLGIKMDPDKNAIISGETKSEDFPTTTNAFNREYNGGQEIFVLKLNFSVPPTEPQNLKIRSGDSFIQLTWEKPEKNGGAEITGYNVYRRKQNSDFNLMAELGNELIYNDTTVKNGIEYYYIVKAKNSVGESLPTAEVNAIPMTIPEPPQNLEVVGGDGYIDLDWDTPSENGGAPLTRYIIYRGIYPNGEIYFDDVNFSSNSFHDANVTNGQIYYYYITSVNIVGESNPTEIVSAIPLGFPTPPRNLSLKAGDSFVNLSWDIPLDDGGAEILGFRLYKGSNPLVQSYFKIIPGNTILFFNDTSVSNGEKYYYYLTTINEVSDSGKSNIINATPLGLPSIPKNPGVTAGDRFVNISWQSPSDDGGANVTGFKIQKVQGSTGNVSFIFIEGIKGTEFYYNDTIVVNGEQYFYYISVM